MAADCIFCHGGASLDDVEAFETESGVRYALKCEKGTWWTEAFKICAKHQRELNCKVPAECGVEASDATREARTTT